MADLDAELLALAGGDSSEDEGLNTNVTAAKIVSPSSAAATVNVNSEDQSTYKSSTSIKPSQRSNGVAGKGTRKSKVNESEEEGEA